MDDENGLELSLALPCGGASASQKNRIGSSSEIRSEEIDRDQKLINDFKNFLEGGTKKLDSGIGSQRNDSKKTEGNFFSNLSGAATEGDTSKTPNSGGFWVGNDSRSIEAEDGKRLDMENKRKSFFGDASQQKRHEREHHLVDSHDRTRASHISINTDEGSTAENEDVADSEAEGSTSRLVLQQDDGLKHHISSIGLSQIHKEVQGAPESSAVELPGQRRFTISSDKEFKLSNMSYGVPYSAAINITNLPYSMGVKDSNPTNTLTPSSYPLPGVVQAMATANNERSGSQPVMPANLPLMFGYSSIQLPTLDKDNSRGLISQQQQPQLPFASRQPISSDKHSESLKTNQATAALHKASEIIQHDGRITDRTKGHGKQHASEEGSSPQLEDDGKGSNVTLRHKEGAEQPKAEGFPSEYPAIRPGLAADLKFGGCGSYPNLPWVSTTAPGPNGHTISGVTYRFSPTQIRIVCACHGTHLSPEEFVRHATEDQNNADTTAGVASFTNGNHAASAQS